MLKLAFTIFLCRRGNCANRPIYFLMLFPHIYRAMFYKSSWRGRSRDILCFMMQIYYILYLIFECLCVYDLCCLKTCKVTPFALIDFSFIPLIEKYAWIDTANWSPINSLSLICCSFTFYWSTRPGFMLTPFQLHIVWVAIDSVYTNTREPVFKSIIFVWNIFI